MYHVGRLSLREVITRNLVAS